MAPNTASKSRLLELLKSKSVFHGDFLLSSGARSNVYVDCKLTTLHPEGAWLVGELMYDMIAAEIQRRGAPVSGVGGLTMGADPIALAIGMVSHKKNPAAPLQVFAVRKSPKSHGQTKLIEGPFQKGDRVVVIDDVVTKGESTIKAIEAVEAEGGKVELVAVLVDREEGGRQKIEARGLKVFPLFTRQEVFGDKQAPASPS